MARGEISGKVLRYFEQYPNQGITVQDLMENTGLQRPQVMNALVGLRSRRYAIVPMISGELYRYIPEANSNGFVPGKQLTQTPVEAPQSVAEPRTTSPAQSGRALRVFEELGTLSDGRVLLRAEDGMIYKAEPM